MFSDKRQPDRHDNRDLWIDNTEVVHRYEAGMVSKGYASLRPPKTAIAHACKDPWQQETEAEVPGLGLQRLNDWFRVCCAC